MYMQINYHFFFFFWKKIDEFGKLYDLPIFRSTG